MGGNVTRASRSHEPSRREDDDDDQVAAPAPAERQEDTEKVSETTDAVVNRINDAILDQMDDVLKKSLDLDSDATDEEYEARARERIAQYVQKGGQ